jgi:glucose-6-phosphate isomerase
LLFDLAGAAGLEAKRAQMGTGQHINNTENRAGIRLTSQPYRVYPLLYFDTAPFVE